jgi:hypothetical protein
MNRRERKRDIFPAQPSQDYWENKQKDGWKLVAAEWEREAEPATSDAPWVEEIPYGMKVGSDSLHLVENTEEKRALVLMLEMIVADKPFSEVAERVNSAGYRTRAGALWSQVDVFELMPRLVEVASRVYPTHDWSQRRKGILKLAH